MDITVPLAITAVALALLVLGAIADDRRARIERRAALAGGEANAKLELPLLHSINDDRCIGCEACVDVCPTEVLELVDHKVRVARFSDCVQCEQCANACPTTALVMFREGTLPRTLTVPQLDEQFQTGVPGQYLIGEVAGKPLVKNAANLGRAVIEHIARSRAGAPAAGADTGADVLDVAIVGSGPGGLSAGLTCVRHQLSCVVLEKEHVLASTVARYPKGKHFMAEPSSAVNVSYLPVFDGAKEELVAAWRRLADGAALPVKLGEAVDTVVRGADGVFTVKTTVASYRARAVVLATGLRGKPRLLAVPGANLEKVQSRLEDAAELAGDDVLVVGGGDSAVESAVALVEAGARVTLSYRGDGFKRCKQGNQSRLAELTDARKLEVLLGSSVTEFTADTVAIKLAGGELTTIPNRHAFVLIGADTPVAWLEANQVRFVEREHLYALGSTEDVVRRLVPDARACPRSPDEALALVLGTAPPAAEPGRLRSAVGHLVDELREVVTGMTSVLRALPSAVSDTQPTLPRHRALAAAAADADSLVTLARHRVIDGGEPDTRPSLPSHPVIDDGERDTRVALARHAAFDQPPASAAPRLFPPPAPPVKPRLFPPPAAPPPGPNPFAVEETVEVVAYDRASARTVVVAAYGRDGRTTPELPRFGGGDRTTPELPRFGGGDRTTPELPRFGGGDRTAPERPAFGDRKAGG